MLPVLGGISGSTKTTLNTNLSGTQESWEDKQKLNSCVPAFFSDLEFASDEFFQLNHVSREFPNSLASFFVRHGVIV
jgi:hypothetical protein